jgi:hypothetical protein
VRRVTATLVVLGLMLAAPAAAGARVVTSFTGGVVAGPVLSSDGRIVLGERQGSGNVPAEVIDPTGARAPQTLATFPAPRVAGWFTQLTLTGTGGVVGVRADVRSFAEPKIGGTELRSSEGRTLLPSAVLGACTGLYPYATGVQVAGGDGFAATLGEDCAAVGGAIRIHGPGGVRTLPTAPGAQTSHLRAAGPYVAWGEVAYGPPFAYAVVLARATTGEVLMRAPVPGFGADDIGLGSDGTVAWVAQTGLRGCTSTLFAASAAVPAPHPVTGPNTPCPFGANASALHGAIAVAGGRVVYPASSTYATLDGSGTGHTIGELPVGGATPGPIAFDGRTLYGVRSDCDGDHLLAVDVSVPGTPPAAIAPDGPICPATLRGSTRRRLDPRTHNLTVPLSCPAGCHGTLRLVQPRRLRERVAGRIEVSGRGAFVARLQPARFVTALAACGSGVRLRATLYRDHLSAVTEYPRTALQLGVLRVRVSGRCRHVAAPAFERRAVIP